MVRGIAVPNHTMSDTKGDTAMSKTIYHNHHIIPKHMGGTDDPSNLVRLTAEEHAEAHRKLYEEHGCWQDKLAWQGLAGIIDKKEIVYKQCSEAGKKGGRKGGKAIWEKMKNNPEYLSRLREMGKIGGKAKAEKYPNFRFKQSPEALAKQKESLTKIKHQQGSKNSQYGTCWIMNEFENKKIKKEDIDIWLEMGYTRGRKMRRG